MNTTVEACRISEIKGELGMENYISQVIENGRLRQREAEALKQSRVEQLRLYIDLQRGDSSGTLQVNQTQIRQIRDKLKLSPATIETTYREQGYEIKPERSEKSVAEILNGFFITETVMAELQKNIEAFQQVPDEKNYPWSGEVRELYELAYYLEGQIEPSADFYRRRDTEDLREIFRQEAQKVSAPIPAWQSLKALLNLAQTQIFNTDENRFKYDHTLKIEPLKEFFQKLKTAPELFKRDRYFADNCIRRIRTQYRNFLNYELSAALYNKAAGLMKEPYESVSEPEENYYSVRCVNCGAQESYRTREEAERGECKICGEKYYVECPKCGRRVPAVAEHCPNCNFSFAELRRYGAYVEQATAMLDLAERSAKYLEENLDAVIARIIEKVSAARATKPDSVELTKLEWRINKLSSEIKKRELIKWAESKLPSLSTAPDTAVSACMEILRRIKDYKPARDRLRLIKPKKPVRIVAMIHRKPAGRLSVSAKSTSVMAANYNLTCTVRWEPDADLGLVYTLVRKIGAVPANYSDGAIIAENTDRIEVEDSDIKPGVFYGYAVYAVRLGAISEPTTCTAVHYSDLDEGKLTARTEDGHCQFTWKLPSDNCLGVRILRSDREGNNVIVADCVQSPFVDRLVKNRKQYEYSLQCVYYSVTEEALPVTGYWKSERGLKYSAGLKVRLTPELPPRVVKNLIFKVVENRVRFSWQNTGEYEIWFKEVAAGRKVTAETGKLINIDKLDEELGSGLILKRAESSDEFCEFELTGDLMRVAILSATPSFFLINEVITLANVEPCEIDDSKTQIVARDLKLVLKNLPKNIYMIHYKIQVMRENVNFQNQVRQGMYNELENLKKHQRGEQFIPILKAIAAIAVEYRSMLSDDSIPVNAKHSLQLLFDELDDILAEHGAQIFCSNQGDIRRPFLTKIISTIPTDNPQLHNTIAKSRRPGVMQNGKPLYREFVDVFVFKNDT